MYTLGNKTEPEYTYHLSVMSIFKNEMMNMKTWVEHYLWQGVDHFYMLDNESDDDPLSYLQPYITKGIVTYEYCPGKYNQVERYQKTYDKIKNDTKWLIICDLDEFFFGKKQNIAHSLDNVTHPVLYCNWIMFGSSGLQQHPDDIRVSLVHRDPVVSKLTKYIIQTKYINSCNLSVHTCDTEIDITTGIVLAYVFILSILFIIQLIEAKNKTIILTSIIFVICISIFIIYMNLHIHRHIRNANEFISLHHYSIQSVEFFQRIKMTRGDVNLISFENIRDMNYFNKYDQPCTELDTTLSDLVKTYYK
jgi:hypothetical protein